MAARVSIGAALTRGEMKSFEGSVITCSAWMLRSCCVTCRTPLRSCGKRSGVWHADASCPDQRMLAADGLRPPLKPGWSIERGSVV